MKQCVRLLVYFLVFLNSTNGLAQERKLDSLMTKLETVGTDLDKQQVLISISRYYQYSNLDSAEYYAFKAEKLAKVIEYQKGIAVSYNHIGLLKQGRGELEQAIIWFDSALTVNRRIKNVDNELANISNLAVTHSNLGNDSIALDLYFQGLRKAQENNLPQRIGSFTGNLGNRFYRSGEFDSALMYYEISMRNFELANDQSLTSLMLNNIGTAYHAKADYAKASLYYKEALDVAEKVKFKYVLNLATQNLALIFKIIGLPEKSIEYSFKILETYQQSGERSKEATLLTNLASLHEGIGKNEEAIEFATKAITIQESLSDPGLLSQSYLIIGAAYLGMSQVDKAYVYTNKALSLAEEHKKTRVQIMAGIDLAKYFNLNGLKTKALQTLVNTIELLDEFESPDHARQAYGMVSEIYSELGDSEKAYLNLLKSNELNDQINEEEQRNAVVRSAIEFETEKKEQKLIKAQQEAEIQSLALEKKELQMARTNLISIVGAILLIATVFIIYLTNSRSKYRLKMQALLSEQRLSRLQMNPHFIFNALASIQNYMNEVSVDKANFYLTRFGKLIRQTLENSRTEFIPLSDEIESIESYLTLQSLYRKNSFEFEIKLNDLEDLDDMNIPPMFIQPFVENAIEHGLATDDSGKVTVTFSLVNDELEIKIEDTGSKNQKITYPLKKEYESLATKITEERIAQLNKIQKTNARLNISDFAEGTMVQLFLPLREGVS